MPSMKRVGKLRESVLGELGKAENYILVVEAK